MPGVVAAEDVVLDMLIETAASADPFYAQRSVWQGSHYRASGHGMISVHDLDIGGVAQTGHGQML